MKPLQMAVLAYRIYLVRILIYPKFRFHICNIDAYLCIATNAEGKKESYWGFDHLGQVLDHLGLQGDEAGTSRDRGWRAML